MYNRDSRGLAALLACALLAACSSTSTSSSTTPSNRPAGGPPGVSMGTATPVDTSTVTVSGSLLDLNDQLKQVTTSTQLASLQLAYSVSSAKQWSNFPDGIYQNRLGPKLSDLSADQLKLVKAALEAAMGSNMGEGWDEIQQILNLDDYLGTKSGGYGSGQYHYALLGTPSASGTWQLYFGGHHLAVTNTYKDGRLVGATPSFRGIEPLGTYAQNGRDNAPLQEERQALADMLAGIDATRAKLPQSFGDVLVGPQKDGTFPATPSGVRVGDLGADQQAKVLAAINTYVDDVEASAAAEILAKYKAELADTYVSYAGTTAVNATGDYVRIDGPSVWIEFSMQNGVIMTGPHPHSVWRDKKTDYGGNT